MGDGIYRSKVKRPNLQYQSTEWTVNPVDYKVWDTNTMQDLLSVERARRWRSEAAFDWRVGKSLEQI